MEIVPVGPGFAAELRGAQIADVAGSSALYKTVRAAFEEHSVLVFRGQHYTDEDQVAFSACFGPLELTKVASLGEGTHYSILTNVAPDGSLVPPGHRETLTARANQLWHTDSTFKAIPALASVLSARTIPADGGETQFASTRLAWQRLSAERRAQLEHAVALHAYAHSRGKIDPNLATAVEQAALPPVRWRLSWPNPANGRRSLYIASHAFAIDGMAKEAAQALLAGLIDEATRPEYTHLHRWQSGDVVMWDNRATVHRGRPWPDDQARHMVRTTISATEADGLDQVRPAA